MTAFNETEGPRARRAQVGFRSVLVVLALVGCGYSLARAQPEERLHAALESIKPQRPLEVAIGVRVNQVVNINQKSESFTVVGSRRLQWEDPKLAFDERKYGSHPADRGG
jgi:Neurotransmitter-gated ion-channel ligand binding domain